MSAIQSIIKDASPAVMLPFELNRRRKASDDGDEEELEDVVSNRNSDLEKESTTVNTAEKESQDASKVKEDDEPLQAQVSSIQEENNNDNQPAVDHHEDEEHGWGDAYHHEAVQYAAKYTGGRKYNRQAAKARVQRRNAGLHHDGPQEEQEESVLSEAKESIQIDASPTSDEAVAEKRAVETVEMSTDTASSRGIETLEQQQQQETTNAAAARSDQQHRQVPMGSDSSSVDHSRDVVDEQPTQSKAQEQSLMSETNSQEYVRDAAQPSSSSNSNHLPRDEQKRPPAGNEQPKKQKRLSKIQNSAEDLDQAHANNLLPSSDMQMAPDIEMSLPFLQGLLVTALILACMVWHYLLARHIPKKSKAAHKDKAEAEAKAEKEEDAANLAFQTGTSPSDTLSPNTIGATKAQLEKLTHLFPHVVLRVVVPDFIELHVPPEEQRDTNTNRVVLEAWEPFSAPLEHSPQHHSLTNVDTAESADKSNKNLWTVQVHFLLVNFLNGLIKHGTVPRHAVTLSTEGGTTTIELVIAANEEHGVGKSATSTETAGHVLHQLQEELGIGVRLGWLYVTPISLLSLASKESDATPLIVAQPHAVLRQGTLHRPNEWYAPAHDDASLYSGDSGDAETDLDDLDAELDEEENNEETERSEQWLNPEHEIVFGKEKTSDAKSTTTRLSVSFDDEDKNNNNKQTSSLATSTSQLTPSPAPSPPRLAGTFDEEEEEVAPPSFAMPTETKHHHDDNYMNHAHKEEKKEDDKVVVGYGRVPDHRASSALQAS